MGLIADTSTLITISILVWLSIKRKYETECDVALVLIYAPKKLGHSLKKPCTSLYENIYDTLFIFTLPKNWTIELYFGLNH